jgi:hypothetical protein
MKRFLFAAFIVAIAGAGLVGFSDEGMWTFDNVPRKLIKETYGST